MNFISMEAHLSALPKPYKSDIVDVNFYHHLKRDGLVLSFNLLKSSIMLFRQTDFGN